jgi:hypothetical protein
MRIIFSFFIQPATFSHNAPMIARRLKILSYSSNPTVTTAVNDAIIIGILYFETKAESFLYEKNEFMNVVVSIAAPTNAKSKRYCATNNALEINLHPSIFFASLS